MKKIKGALTLATAASLTLSLAACGGGSKGSDSKEAKTLPQTSYQEAAYDKVKQGGQLTFAISQLPDNFNNNQANGSLGDTQNFQGPLMGGATKVKADGSWEVDKNYASEVKLVGNDPQKVSVKLNPKAVWSDGKAITYKDEQSNFKAMSGQDSKYQPASTTCWEDIKSVDKGSSDYDYTVTFKKKNSEWVNCIYPLLPSVAADTPEAFNNTYAQKQFPTNGPYVVSKVDTTAKVITETPNPKWWGRKPKLDKIIWRVVDQNSLGQSFANGEIDVLDTQANRDTLAQAQKRSDAEVQRAGGLTWTHLTFNASKAPFNDVNVRKGIAQAINREDFAKVVQKGLGVEPVTQGGALLVPGQKGYQDVYGKALPFDTSAAEKDFEKAGYKKNGDKLEKDGKQLEFAITVPSGTATNSQRAQLIQSYLQKVGIKVDLNTVPTAKYFNDYVKPKNFQAVTFSWVGTPLPISTSEPIFYPKDAGNNYTGIQDDATGKAFGKALQDLDASHASTNINAVEKAIADYVPLVPFTPTPTIFVVKKGVVNVGAGQFLSLPYVDWTQVGMSS